MAAVLLGLLYLLAVVRSWQGVETTTAVYKPMCSDGSDRKNCRCDELCVRYGDCCSDAPYFVSPDQHPVPLPFICHVSNVYMVSSCPADWNDPSTQYRCEHPDTTYQDPLFDVPVTSYRTNITYRNRYCALCHRDLDARKAEFWSIYFSCGDDFLTISEDEGISCLEYNTANLSWVLNMSAHPELLWFDNPTPTNLVYKCNVGVEPTNLAQTVSRTCYTSIVDTCPDEWSDDGVRAGCAAHTAHACLGDTVYRNVYCGICNNNGISYGLYNSSLYNGHFAPVNRPFRCKYGRCLADLPYFWAIIRWKSETRGATCQQDTEQYDPLKKTCRTIFVKPETYSMTLKPDEYKIHNESGLLMSRPLNEEFPPETAQGIGYLTVIGLSLSILFLVLHLTVFAMTPKLRHLSSMNLASLSVSLLVMYCSFLVGYYLSDSAVPCVVLAVVTHYSLLASFCWMLTIAYDINRVIRQTATHLLIAKGKQWRRFGIYSLWSWTFPAAIVGAALVANFSTVQVYEFLRPVYGGKNCYISNATALLIFTVAPLFVVMVANAIFFFWSAYLIRAMRSELGNATTNTTNIQLYARLAVVMGLTWAVGLIAGYVEVLVVWYVFVFLNTLQGHLIFLAFSCKQKVWTALRKQPGQKVEV